MSEVQMPEYVCHKKVRAAKIVAIDYVSNRLTLSVGVIGRAVYPGNEWLVKNKPEIGGYYVEYADGYTSYSPAKAFEEGYTLSKQSDTTSGSSGTVAFRNGWRLQGNPYKKDSPEFIQWHDEWVKAKEEREVEIKAPLTSAIKPTSSWSSFITRILWDMAATDKWIHTETQLPVLMPYNWVTLNKPEVGNILHYNGTTKTYTVLSKMDVIKQATVLAENVASLLSPNVPPVPFDGDSYVLGCVDGKIEWLATEGPTSETAPELPSLPVDADGVYCLATADGELFWNLTNTCAEPTDTTIYPDGSITGPMPLTKNAPELIGADVEDWRVRFAQRAVNSLLTHNDWDNSIRLTFPANNWRVTGKQFDTDFEAFHKDLSLFLGSKLKEWEAAREKAYPTIAK